MYQFLIREELNKALQILLDFINEDNQIKFIEDIAKRIANTFKAGKKLFTCGNGGSHCDAMHFAEELTGCYRNYRTGYPAIVVSDPSYLSCVSNDFGYDYVFSRYVEAVGSKGDILVGISTSGNSINIINAVESARAKDMYTIGITGKDGGNMSNKVDMEICIPYFGYPDRIQEMHIKIIHILILLIEKEME